MTAAGPSAVTRLGSLCVSVGVPVPGPRLAVGVSLSKSVAVTVSQLVALFSGGFWSSDALSRSDESGWLQQSPDPARRRAPTPGLLRLCRVDAGTTPGRAAPCVMAAQPRCHSPDIGRIPARYPPTAVGIHCIRCGACHDRATNSRLTRVALRGLFPQLQPKGHGLFALGSQAVSPVGWRESLAVPRRLMAGLLVLVQAIEVRILAWEHNFR
jgi:hypothetical protein